MAPTLTNASQVDLREYLLQRLAQLGLSSIHGVPGDCNLTVLDYLKPTGLHWVGNANELCAGYAADGYVRIKAPRSASIDQYSLWLRMSNFLQPGDIVMTETGTASYGGQGLALPNGTTLINSSIWPSIGYMLPACQGAELVERDMANAGTRALGRTILFEGDGSLQMTAQAISDIIRNKLDVIIFSSTTTDTRSSGYCMTFTAIIWGRVKSKPRRLPSQAFTAAFHA
ncbi:hypothetical protein ASPVEDRAFT_882525 [Aspergillus versicolor CBS 583.65]|uniref:Pyruvate decarboxylase n=1 Tax=Aspergillus versicolor CBS 583.65 TaxID=1036611 RepID=A0A1L9PCS4_ASPVE|nr:uncharacterized protein ASPVEDRAFT_882525 [Aspergillus versicolor CBS 583.65]OJI99264.1 hypothetical protein ASPVEDRAFT_882525 [Aspergillus versicolor CBS 583.65]